MDLIDRFEVNKKQIVECLDPDFGLLDELLANKSLMRQEVAKVRAVADSYGRSEKLLEYVSHSGFCDKFLDALKKTKQTHLVNFILSNGQRSPDFGDDWPLTEKELLILDTNHPSLVDLLETSDLILHLYSQHIINNRQRDVVSSRLTSHEKNEAFLEILRRTSLENYEKTIHCLHSSNQNHIAKILKEGGGIVRVHLELETEGNLNEAEDELVGKISEMLSEHSLEDLSRILKSTELRLIAAKKGNSIILYFYCKTSAEFANLQELQVSGKLAIVVRDIFNTLLSHSKVTNLRTALFDEDLFTKCVGATAELEKSGDEQESAGASKATDYGKMTMGNKGQNVEAALREMIDCPICMNVFTDPRMLPCIHTFCFECLRRTGEAKQMKPGNKMPCPLCHKEFTIPAGGIIGVQRNFSVDNLKTTLLGKQPTLKIAAETEEDVGLKQMANTKYCTKHIKKPFENYCTDCKTLVCDSCHAQSHELHDCKDIALVEEEFRHAIKRVAWKTSNFADEMLSLKKNAEMMKADFFQKIEQNEAAIKKRNQELKDMIDRQTISLLNELSMIKSNRQKDMENKMEEIERCYTTLRSFESYSTELASKGSATDICSSVDQIIARADELEKDHEVFIGRPHKSVEVAFKTTEAVDNLKKKNCNFVGNLDVSTETTAQLQNFAVVLGFNDGVTMTEDVAKINLCRPHKISSEKLIPTAMKPEAFAAVYCNAMYVAGVGINADEIWKYRVTFGWVKCASLVQGRRRHSAAFVDEVLYICGGFVESDGSVLDSVEAYNAVTDKCTTVGKLVHCVGSSGNCVPYKSSIYIFGGADKDGFAMNHVQVYNTKENTCSVLSTQMPFPSYLMRAVLWETSVILLGQYTCFIFNLETETWQEREQFKTDVGDFGLVLDNDRIFVIGGGVGEVDEDDKIICKLRDDVRYVPLQNIIDNKAIEWKIHATLPKPSLVQAFANMRFPV